MPRMVGRTLALFASILVAGAVLSPARAQEPSQQGGIHPSISGVAAQLGAKAQSPGTDDLQIGASFTAILDEPGKLAELGIDGMHSGARVTVARVAPDRVRVEVDEMEPVSHSAAITLRLGSRGELSKVPKS